MNESTILKLIERDVSAGSRLRATLVGIGGLGMAGMLTVLWATEPTPLPTRTAIAFATMIAIGLSWVGFATWVLAVRRPLYAQDSIVSGRLALGFSTVFAGAGTLVAAANGSKLWWIVLVAGLALVMVAAFLLVAATRRRRRLQELKARLSAAE